MRRERLARRRLTGDAGRAGHLGRPLHRQIVLADACLRLLQLEFELVEQPGGPFGATAVEVALELLDLELQGGDQRLVAGPFGPRLGGVRLGQRSSAMRFDQRGAQGVDVVGQGVHGAGLYPETRTQSSLFPPESGGLIHCAAAYPAERGLQVCCGLRQSMASSRYANWDAEMATAPLAGLGQMKRPRSSLLA
nr:hypothetical protein ABAZ39_13705 [Azospirillum argentinense]